MHTTNQCGSSASTPKGSGSSTPGNLANATGSSGVIIDDVFNGYLSDLSDLESDDSDLNEQGLIKHGQGQQSAPVRYAPPLKRRRLEVPARTSRQQAQIHREKALESALEDIEKIIRSKTNTFSAGQHGLQAYRARAIQSCLWMVVQNKKNRTEASERAAESQGFAKRWGGRMVRQWVRKWVDARELPVSFRGCHMKTFSLYDDPAIRDELRSFLRSNKWAMNPEKLVEFSKEKMVPAAAEQYLKHLTEIEMPQGLKKYMELELFPRIQLKPSKGISVATACRFLKREGFQFQKYKKSLYYDGHERPDVVADRQERFLPAMAKYEERLVEYIVGDVEHKVPKNIVGRRLVLASHDEMTAQANDDGGEGWVREQRLKKKGAGRGLHQSDVICPTVGWLQEASQTLEYGKNYEGYWTGELFVKQVPVFSICGDFNAHRQCQ